MGMETTSAGMGDGTYPMGMVEAVLCVTVGDGDKCFFFICEHLV